MCAIAGIVSLQNTPIANVSERIEAMNNAQAHRGPDGAGIWINKETSVGLGHRRLAIVDLSPLGHQPMTNEDETIWIVFNGEIYNHLAVRQELETHGHTFRSQSDTETIIHAYETWGTACLDRLQGMFAFAIWDTNKRTLFFARDRIGIKPFYYTQHDGTFYFASEIKAILANQEIPRRMDEEAFYHFLTFFASPAPRTLFAGIHKLEPGYYGVVDSHGSLTLHQYWDALPPEQLPQKTPPQWEKEIVANLRTSINSHLMSDVPFGAYLSGGVDSSVITVLMNRMMHRPIDTFSVGFKNNPEHNELTYAKRVAKRYKANYHEMLIDKRELKAFFPKLAYYQDDPLADWVSYPLYYVSKLVRDKKVIVAQVGEGSDELFAGYTGYLQFLRLAKPYAILRRLPKPLRYIFWQAAQLTYRFHANRFLAELFRRAYFNQELFWGAAIAFTEHEKERLLSPDWRNKYSSYAMVKRHYDRIAKERPQSDTLQRMTYLEFKQRLAELLLMRVDRMSMAVSIEARVPFLDHAFVEHALGIPTPYKIASGTKSLFKHAVEGIIPKSIIYRKKKGFAAPIATWLTDDDIGGYLMGIIYDSTLVANGTLSRDYIKQLHTWHCQKRSDYSVQLWTLAVICSWYETWITPHDSTYHAS